MQQKRAKELQELADRLNGDTKIRKDMGVKGSDDKQSSGNDSKHSQGSSDRDD